MKDWWYPTAFSCWGPEEDAAIDRVRKSGRFTMGPEVKAFEEEFAQWHGRKYGIMVNSGSSANLIAVAAIAENSGERWLNKYQGVARIPAIAWSTTYAPLKQYGFDSFDVQDVDNTWNVSVKNQFDDGSDITVICPVLGNPPINEVMFNTTPILEDCCESLGARTKSGILCGTFGDVSTFSFYYSHQISAIEGGMILTDSAELARLCKILRAHGWTRDVDEPKSFDDEYNFTHFGYNVRPVEVHAAIAREQLKKLHIFIKHRQINLEYFSEVVQEENLPIKLQKMQGTPSPFGLAFTCESKEKRQLLVNALRNKGIDCRLPTGGSFLKHPYGELWRDQQTPNADRIHDTGLFLGNAPYDITIQIKAAVEVMKEVL